MIWAILTIGIVSAVMAITTSWIYKEMPTDQIVSPYQGGSFIKAFGEQFNITEPDADARDRS